jgi:hypothetical protein
VYTKNQKTEYCVERTVLRMTFLVKGANLRYCTFTVNKSVLAFNKQDLTIETTKREKVLALISLLFESLMFVFLIFHNNITV